MMLKAGKPMSSEARTMPETDIVEPILTACLTDMQLPKFAKSMTDIADPRRANRRIDVDDPKTNMSPL
jgi:uncharacterized ferredoxin-like protein